MADLQLQGIHTTYISYQKKHKLQQKESTGKKPRFSTGKKQKTFPTIGFPDTFPGIHIRNQSLPRSMKGAKIFYGGKMAAIQMRSLFFGLGKLAISY